MGLLLCFIQLFSYGKHTDDKIATETTISQDAYNALLQKVWDRDRVDLRYTAPREWPRFSYLSENRSAANEATVMPIEIATPPRYGTGSF